MQTGVGVLGGDEHLEGDADVQRGEDALLVTECVGQELEQQPREPGVERALGQVGAGEVGALIGPNGSGKTTLLKLPAGLAASSTASLVSSHQLTELEHAADRAGGVRTPAGAEVHPSGATEESCDALH